MGGVAIFKQYLRRDALLEAVIGVKRPLAPAGGGLGIQPVGWEHHEDEVGVELLLLLPHAADVVLRFHTCRGDTSVRPPTPSACFCSRGRPRPCSLALSGPCLLKPSAF